MFPNNKLREYIDRELMECVPTLNPATRLQLSDISEAFINNRVSFNQAMNFFTECGCPQSVITKFAHFKAVGEEPLPSSFSAGSNPTISQIPNSAPPSKSLSPSSMLLNPSKDVPNADNKNNSTSCNRKRAVVWSEEEDARLIAAISRFGFHDWRMVAAFVGSGRTSSQCNQRWTRALNPAISHQPWTREEDFLLMKLVGEMGECGWRKIAMKIEGRTDLQCRHRYLTLKKAKESDEGGKSTPPNEKQNNFNDILSAINSANSSNGNNSSNNSSNTESDSSSAGAGEKQIFLNEEFFSKINLLSKQAVPELMTIDKMPFQRLPPLMFPRQGSNSV
ncbi:Myb-like DNA-binding domain containing protein [Tritrichomonas foetus]|uniref:Myb-like DNA-binding domain containing protein n=1 Tax=Tritrichomonas foetus TaxID=1144522 RepID=A0A1J4KET5_9EUKA|nr:Myb-like DNA-binding domain containing protein [Tritrichomonas foetus]|eukprot:OHT08102.1 Myb-like DNA-binding domain containing protein [Tritrichomonas foetus]